jgi:ATP-dependent DNA ligase
MTELNPTPAPATLVAIDIAKHRHEVLIEAPGQSRRRRLTILNTKADHDRLVRP